MLETHYPGWSGHAVPFQPGEKGFLLPLVMALGLEEKMSNFPQTTELAGDILEPPGTLYLTSYPPKFFEVLENGWFRPDTRWEEVDMDRSTVLEYPNLSAELLEQAAQRAFREWAMRPGPVWTFLTSVNGLATLRSALSSGLQHLSWIKS